MGGFDPYHRWLSIPPEEQPPDHYRLLGLKRYEADPDVIETAADRQMAHLRTYQSGKHAQTAQEILNEIAAAKLVLLRDGDKSAYDKKLRASRRKKQKIATATPLEAKPVRVAPPETSIIDSPVSPTTAGLPAKLAPKPIIPAGRSNGFPIIVLAGGVAIGLFALLAVGGVAMIMFSGDDQPVARQDKPAAPPPPAVRPTPPRLPAVDDGTKPNGGSSDGNAGDGSSPMPIPPPVSEDSDGNATPADSPGSNPPSANTPQRLDVPVLKFDPAKHVLVITGDGGERSTCAKACSEYGLKAKNGSFKSRDFSEIHTIFAGSNAMDYWGGTADRKKAESFAPFEKFVTDGGHLMIMGTYNGRNMGHMRRFGIKTGFNHADRFRRVPEHTDVFFKGAESLVRPNNKMRSAGHFSVSKPHIVLLNRDDEHKGPALVTLPYGEGRVTFSQVEPHWMGDLWLIKVLMAWVARGSPAYADDAEYSMVLAAQDLPTSGNEPQPVTPAAKRHPVPDRSARDAAAQRIAKIFPLEENAPAEQKREMAQRLLQVGRETPNDPVAQFVLYNRSRELAAEGAQMRLAIQAIDELEANFDFDASSIRLATLGIAVKTNVPPDEKREVVLVGLEVIDRLLAQDDFTASDRLTTSLLEVARRARDSQLIQSLVERRKRARDWLDAFEAAEAALATLTTDPDDPAANLAAGRYTALIKGQWNTGLPMLAKGGDDPLAVAARGQLAGDASANAEALADQWWNLAQAESNTQAKRILLDAALNAYVLAEPKVSGLGKIKVERRMKELCAELELAAHWAFEQIEGTTTRDLAGGHDGTALGNSVLVEGVSGKAMRFDGRDDCVDIGNPDELNFEGPITISLWARALSLPPENRGDDSVRNLIAHGFHFQEKREVRFSLHTTSGGPIWYAAIWKGDSVTAKTNCPPSDVGIWIHFCTTCDGSAWRLFRNGQQVSVSPSQFGAVKVSADWAIGAHARADRRKFHGDIDDVRIYRRALSRAEIAKLASHDDIDEVQAFNRAWKAEQIAALVAP